MQDVLVSILDFVASANDDSYDPPPPLVGTHSLGEIVGGSWLLRERRKHTHTCRVSAWEAFRSLF